MDVIQLPDLHEARLLQLHRQLPRPQQVARLQVQVILQNLRAEVPASRAAQVEDPPNVGHRCLSTMKLAGHVYWECELLGRLPPCRFRRALPPRSRSGRVRVRHAIDQQAG
ncbi:MAG: hypothetical protein KUL81_05580 [Azonexus sp.]|nr:hypothetical protein [Azonexus sp.]